MTNKDLAKKYKISVYAIRNRIKKIRKFLPSYQKKKKQNRVRFFTNDDLKIIYHYYPI